MDSKRLPTQPPAQANPLQHLTKCLEETHKGHATAQGAQKGLVNILAYQQTMAHRTIERIGIRSRATMIVRALEKYQTSSSKEQSHYNSSDWEQLTKHQRAVGNACIAWNERNQLRKSLAKNLADAERILGQNLTILINSLFIMQTTYRECEEILAGDAFNQNKSIARPASEFNTAYSQMNAAVKAIQDQYPTLQALSYMREADEISKDQNALKQLEETWAALQRYLKTIRSTSTLQAKQEEATPPPRMSSSTHTSPPRVSRLGAFGSSPPSLPEVAIKPQASSPQQFGN